MHFFRPRSKSPVIQPPTQSNSSQKSSGRVPNSPVSPAEPQHSPQHSHHHHHHYSNSIGATSSLNDSQGGSYGSLLTSEVERGGDAAASVASAHRMQRSSPPASPGGESNSKKFLEDGDPHVQNRYRGGGGGDGLSYARHQKGRSGAGGSFSRSPIPRPPAASGTLGKGSPSVSSGAPPALTSSPGPTSRYLVKGVESHVRLTSHRDSFSISLPSTSSAAYTSIHWERRPTRREEGTQWKGGLPKEKGGSGVMSGGKEEGGNSSAHGKNEDRSSRCRDFQVTQVHSQISTPAFYEEVVAPCVANSLAGQSYVFLVNGPPESGRSQTMYGAAHPAEKGIVELAARDLLQRAGKRREAAVAAARAAEGGNRALSPAPPTLMSGMRTVSPSRPPTGSLPHSSSGGGTSSSGVVDVGASLAGLTVTYSAFLTRGSSMTETAPIPVLVPSTFAAMPPGKRNAKEAGERTAAPQGGPNGSPGHPISLPVTSSVHASSPTCTPPPTSTDARSCTVTQMLSGQPVHLIPFPPPLGAFPLAHMQLLESAEKAVVLPEKKHSETSCIIQFQVYAPMETHGTTRSFATLTFIDVAPFTVPLSSEVEHLWATIRRVSGIDTSSPPEFGKTALTSLLEPALTGGSVTLMNISTVSGRPDLYEPGQVALQFASDMTKVQQVLLLTHLRPPRWLFEAGQSLEAKIRLLREEVEAAHYEKGVQDYYETLQRWLDKNINEEAEHLADNLSRETEAAREHLASETFRWIKDLEQQIAELSEETTREKKSLEAVEDDCRYQAQQLEVLTSSLNAAKEKIHEVELEAARRVSETRLAITQLETSEALQKQEWNQFSKSLQSYQSKIHDLEAVLRRYAEDLQKACASYRYAKQLATYKRRREDLEEELVAVSKIASQRHESWKIKRERRSKMARIEALEKRVEALRGQLSGKGS